jgi:hypothetical protein
MLTDIWTDAAHRIQKLHKSIRIVSFLTNVSYSQLIKKSSKT